MSHLKTTTVSASNKSSKDILARAMAQEDIFVEHSASAETASFDVKNRRLVLPVWKDMDNALYDMLVGHEVSHALNTPATGWQEFVGNGPKSSIRHMFVNVVEDARIERMIKAKFPGLRRDFAAAYASLHERDLFQIAGKDLSDLPLIDRLNLHFKIGLFGLETITFSADEQQYVTRMAETTTFEEVMVLAEELFNLWNDDQEEPEQESGDQPQESGEGDGPSGESESGEQGEDEPKGNGSSGGESGEGEDVMTVRVRVTLPSPVRLVLVPVVRIPARAWKTIPTMVSPPRVRPRPVSLRVSRVAMVRSPMMTSRPE